jgi:hypothetical protein
MMDSHDTDSEIRSLYQRLEPRVNTEAFEANIEARVGRRRSRVPRTKTVRTVVVASLALLVIAGLATGIFEASRHLGKDRSILVLTDQTTSSNGAAGELTGTLRNPYPTVESATLPPGSPSERQSSWAEALGSAILKHYPAKKWKVLRAVELSGSPAVMDLQIGLASTGTTPTSSGDPTTPTAMRVQIMRQEQADLSNPMGYPEFTTAYGHGILMASYAGSYVTYRTRFVRPDDLFILLGVTQPQAENGSSTLFLDEKGTQGLTEFIAQIIQLGEAGTLPTSTSTTTAPVLSAEVKGYLDTLESYWTAAGVPVLSVGIVPPAASTEKMLRENTKDTDVLPYAALELPASAFETSDYTFMYENIMRQTMVAIRDGVPLHYLAIFEVNEDGTRTMYSMGEVYQLATAFAPEWDQPARLSLELTTERVRQAATQAAATAKVTLESVEVTEDASGRVLTAVGSIPDVNSVTVSVSLFNGPFEEIARQLNKAGAKISGVNVKVDDLQQAPVLRFVLSLSVGGGLTSRWMAPQLEALRNQ